MNEAEKPGGESEKSGSGIKGILVSAAFTLLGAIIGVVGKGVFENSWRDRKRRENNCWNARSSTRTW
jgi:uncharacterized membrane protein YdfJ with MMPL/SSD domain